MAQTYCQDAAWKIGGTNGIRKNHIMLIGFVHVSQGSWQPILQLNRNILARSPHWHFPNFRGNERSVSEHKAVG
jgi:hypothetical protein